MLNFEPSEKLTAFVIKAIKTHLPRTPNGPPFADAHAHPAMQDHIKRTVDFVISNHCRYLQYEGAQSVTIFDDNGFSDLVEDLLLEHIAFIAAEDEKAFINALHDEVKTALAAQPNPVLSRQWGTLTYTNGRLEADIQPRRRRDLSSIFKP